MTNDTFKGKSGKNYTFERHPISKMKDGNLKGRGTYMAVDKNNTPIYIGTSGAFTKRVTKNHEHWNDIKKTGGTDVLVHKNPNKNDRLKEEQDLIKGLNPSINVQHNND